MTAADGETEGDDFRPANFDVWPLEIKQCYWRRRSALVDAFHRHQFRGICPECQGNGCEKCQKKGYLTLADCNRLTEGLETEETPL